MDDRILDLSLFLLPEGALSPLTPNEQRLEGEWVEVDAKVVADETARRIEELISTELIKLATSASGWDTLYVDQRDGRKWELTYPHGEWHGGGPPTLTCVSDNYAQSKYKV
jgi:hypothetical protein